jgi:preprotein translocase subunit SecG
MKKSILVKAFWPVGICVALALVLYILIGREKGGFAFEVFGMPWTTIFEIDPYVGYPTQLEILFNHYYGGLFVNAVILYFLSALYLRIQSTNSPQ